MNLQVESTTINSHLRDMTRADLDAVLLIEQTVHEYPWTRGNFSDALVSHNVCQVYEAAGEIVGYVVLMRAVDEVQLLNISIAAAYQRRGLGATLLRAVAAEMRGLSIRRMLLEVRPSNAAARGLYDAFGFTQIGLRRGYYVARQGREDAMVMEYVL